MRVAYIMPHSYESFYTEEKNKMNKPSEFDKQILVYKDEYAHRICKASKFVGIEPTLYYFSSDEKKKATFTHKYGHKMVRLPVTLKRRGYGKYGWEFSLELFKELSTNNFDLVFVFTYALNDLLPLDMYDLIALYCKNKGYPLIARHGGGSAQSKIFGHSIIFKNWIKKFTLDIADTIIPENKHEQLVLRKMGLDENKLTILRNPIDYDHFYEISKRITVKKLKKDPSKKYILYVGRLQKIKGIHHILNVLPKLIKLHPNIHFLIVGTGPFKSKLNQMIKQKNLQKYVSFEGNISHDQTKTLL